MPDAALVAADGMFQDLAHMDTPGIWAGMGAGPEMVGIEIQGSKTFSRTVTFYDADGNLQDAYDELTTDRIDVVTVVNREVAREDWSAVINREREMTITGLAGEEGG